MLRVRCPGCERTLKVPDDDRDSVRCPSCRESFRPRQRDYEERRRPREERTRVPPPRPREKRVAPRPSDRRTAYLVFAPAGVLMLMLAPFFLMITVVVMFFGMSLTILGLKRRFSVMKAKGLTSPDADLPWYLRGGIFGLIAYVRQVCAYPHLLGLWFFLEIYGIGLLMGGGLILSYCEPPLHPGEKRSAAQPTSPTSPGPAPGPAPASAPGSPPGPAPATPSTPPAPGVPRITGDEQIDRALADLMDERAPFNRDRGANALAAMPPSNAHRAVVAQKLAAVANADSIGQRTAAQALALWATPNEIPVLINLFRKRILRREAIQGLRTVGPAAEKDVLPLLDERDPFSRKEAAEILADIGTAQSLPALQALPERNPAFVREAARKAIAAIKARMQQ